MNNERMTDLLQCAERHGDVSLTCSELNELIELTELVVRIALAATHYHALPITGKNRDLLIRYGYSSLADRLPLDSR
jgi:hypothetical protein